MREGAVSLGHAVRVFTFLDRGALVVVGVHELSSDTVSHAHTLAATACCDKPHRGEVVLALTFNFKRDLVVGTTDTATASLHVWANVAKSLLKHIEWVVNFKLVSSSCHTFVDEAFGSLLFTVAHNAVDKALHRYAVVQAVSRDITN